MRDARSANGLCKSRTRLNACRAEGSNANKLFVSTIVFVDVERKSPSGERAPQRMSSSSKTECVRAYVRGRVCVR